MQATFCFVDVAGFTALTATRGDNVAADLISRFRAAVDGSLAGDAAVVDMIGDVAFLVADDPERMLRSVQRLWRSVLHEHDFPLLHAGLHHGDAVLRDGRWVGAAANLTARVAAHARGGQVLATSAVVAGSDQVGVVARSIGPTSLRNLIEPVELFEIDVVVGEESSRTEAIDPVCRMRVFPDSARGHVRHSDRDFWFCSLECVARFASEPSVYSVR